MAEPKLLDQYRERLLESLRTHLDRVKVLHERDLSEGFGDVYLPFALARKYPHAGRSWPWQYVFPSGSRSTDPLDGIIRRHHLDEKVIQRAVSEAARKAGIAKPVSLRGVNRDSEPRPWGGRCGCRHRSCCIRAPRARSKCRA